MACFGSPVPSFVCVLLIVLPAGERSSAIASETLPQKFEITIRNGEVKKQYRKLRVLEGEHVAIYWFSDVSSVVHLEGYDISVDIGLDSPGKLEFDAIITGRFPIHVHAKHRHDQSNKGGNRHGAVSFLEVHPK